jgi:hypothetical protein
MLLTSRSPDIVACYFAYAQSGQRYEMTPLNLFSYAELDLLAAKMVSLARDPMQNGSTYLTPNAGVFCDNCFHDLRSWMIPTNNTDGSGHGNTSETPPFLATAYYVNPDTNPPGYETDWNELASIYGTPSNTWRDYAAKYTYLTAKVAAVAASSGTMFGMAPWRIANAPESGPNGTYQHPMPWMFENIYSSYQQGLRTAAESIRQWKLDQRNVLVHVCDGTPLSWTRVETVIGEWRVSGGWLDFKYSGDPGSEQQYWDAIALANLVKGQL